jgi:hypothetical protein
MAGKPETIPVDHLKHVSSWIAVERVGADNTLRADLVGILNAGTVEPLTGRSWSPHSVGRSVSCCQELQ